MVADDLLWKKTKSLGISQARRAPRTRAWNIFGGLAILVTCVTLDPLALRPRLSPGLPLSDFFCLLSEHAAGNPSDICHGSGFQYCWLRGVNQLRVTRPIICAGWHG